MQEEVNNLSAEVKDVKVMGKETQSFVQRVRNDMEEFRRDITMDVFSQIKNINGIADVQSSLDKDKVR